MVRNYWSYNLMPTNLRLTLLVARVLASLRFSAYGLALAATPPPGCRALSLTGSAQPNQCDEDCHANQTQNRLGEDSSSQGGGGDNPIVWASGARY